MNDMRKKKGGGSYIKNTLSFKDRLRLLEWLRSHKDKFFTERPRYETVAEQASKELELEISSNVCRSTAKDGGIRWRPIYTRKDTGKPHRYHNNTRDSINLLKRQVTALKTALRGLYRKLGEQVDPEIGELWPQYSIETTVHNNTVPNWDKTDQERILDAND